MSRLTEPGPRLIEVGPIRSSVSLKLAHRLTAQVERLRVDNQRLRERVGELAARVSTGRRTAPRVRQVLGSPLDSGRITG